ncbi:MAG: KH domain-containing protein [Nanoarchaeota archaeon]
MEKFYFQKISELKKERKNLEDQLKVKISLTGKLVFIEGDSVAEYEASIVMEAMQLGFSVKKALALKDPEMKFLRLHIRDFTRRKNLKDVRARIIGKEGKTKRTIESISDCDIVISDSEVGIIGSTESIEDATTAIKNIIKGSKQANAYRYLERRNATKREEMQKGLDLGLKNKKTYKK